MSETMRETMSEAEIQAMRETGEGTNRRERANRDGFNSVSYTHLDVY